MDYESRKEKIELNTFGFTLILIFVELTKILITFMFFNNDSISGVIPFYFKIKNKKFKKKLYHSIQYKQNKK